MGAALVLRCSPHCCHQLGAECEEESIGLVGFESLSVLDWGQGLANGEPVGRILHGTLNVNEVDSDLLCFAASSALTVVRWLLRLGARPDVSDCNGTTVLHAACRSGSLAVVKQFIKETALLNKPDVAGWTPLHIAAHMGRRAVVVRLIQAKAMPGLVNSRGLKAADLCKDTVTYQAIIRNMAPEQADPKLFPRGVSLEKTGLDSLADEECEEASDDLVGLPQQCEPELFFVNPRPVFSHTVVHRKALLGLAAAVFNLQPSHGLALVVLTGLEEGYTSAMKVLLKQNVSRRMAGSFLGEPLSVCPLIRFSFFDSLPMLNTGVISCLRTIFSALGIPEELQKLDRILWAVASVWWRKHKALKEAGRAVQPGRRVSKIPSSELSGMELFQYLSGQEALYQLMLSTLLLHRRIWGGANNMPTGPMDFEEWVELNQGIERQGEDNVPLHVQRKIYNDIVSLRVPELCIWPANEVVVLSENIPEEALPGPVGQIDMVLQKAYAAGESALQHRAVLEGWLWVYTSALLPGSLGSSECAHTFAQEEEVEVPDGSMHRIWGSLCSMCLVFSSQAPGTAVPHAIIDCRGLQFLDISHEAKTLTLAVKPIIPESLTTRRMGDELLRAAKLLPDGRWEELCMQKLKMSFDTAELLDHWVEALMQKPCEAALPDHLQSGGVLRARADAVSSAFNADSAPDDVMLPRGEPIYSQDKDEELHEASFVGVL